MKTWTYVLPHSSHFSHTRTRTRTRTRTPRHGCPAEHLADRDRRPARHFGRQAQNAVADNRSDPGVEGPVAPSQQGATEVR